MKRLLPILALLPAIALAQTVTQTVTRDGITLTAPQEQRAEAIGNQLRCLVCQNESIEASSAGLAKQLRVIIRNHIVAGDSSKDILHYMVQRYGIFVLLKPPFMRLTWLLYASPFLALLVGFITAWAARRNRSPAPAPLSPAERDRLNEILKP